VAVRGVAPGISCVLESADRVDAVEHRLDLQGHADSWPGLCRRASHICWTCWPIILARAAEVTAGRPEPLNGQRVRPARRPPATLLASTHAPVERRADGTGSHRCALLAQSRSLRNSAGVKPACRRIDAKVPRFTTPC
jgi:hypothetical protein